MNDGKPLYNDSHYAAYRRMNPWYVRAWLRIKAIFIGRPKLTASNLENGDIIVLDEVGDVDWEKLDIRDLIFHEYD